RNYMSAYSDCDSGTMAPLPSGSGTSVQVTPQPAQSIVCTFTNARKPSVTVVKSLVPSSDRGLFTLSAGATTANDQGNGGSATTSAVTLGNGVLVQETAGTGT